MRFCHLTSAHSITDTRIFYKECKSLIEAGYNVTFIVPYEIDKYFDGVHILGIKKSKTRRERITKTVGQVYKRALECDADIYHFHDPELIPVGLLLKWKGKKIVYDVHEDAPRLLLSKQWIPGLFRKTVSWILERIENLAAKRFDYIITATPSIGDRFLRINKNTTAVNNYPLLSELYLPNTNWDNKDKMVCYVGGIGKKRGIQEMVEALGMTRSVNMLLEGEFKSSMERDKVVSKNGWSKVVELGNIDRDSVKKVLSRSMAGLVLFYPEPNNINAQPNKMFEYMSAGVPVIGSNFLLWKEIIEGNDCGICVDPLNIYEIAHAINWVVDNPDRAEQMGINGRKAVEAKYNWENEANKLLKIYEELLH